MNTDYYGLYQYLMECMQNRINTKDIITMNNAKHVHAVLQLSLPVLYREMIMYAVE